MRELVDRFDRVIVPELNNGQLVRLLRAELGCDAESLTKVAGQPFRIQELVDYAEARRKAA